MDIQSVFYLLASIFLILSIAVLVAMLLFMWQLQSSIRAFQKKAENIRNAMKERKFMTFMPLFHTILKWIVERKNKQTS